MVTITSVAEQKIKGTDGRRKDVVGLRVYVPAAVPRLPVRMAFESKWQKTIPSSKRVR